MTCAEFREYITEYLDGELSPELQDEMCTHMRGCEDCALLEAEYRQALSLCGQLSPKVPDVVTPATAVIKSVRRKSKMKWVGYVAAACIVLTLGTIAVITNNSTSMPAKMPAINETTGESAPEMYSGGAAFDDATPEEAMPAPEEAAPEPAATLPPQAPLESEAPEEAPAEGFAEDYDAAVMDFYEYARLNPVEEHTNTLFVHANDPEETLVQLETLYYDGRLNEIGNENARLAVLLTDENIPLLEELISDSLQGITLVVFENITIE